MDRVCIVTGGAGFIGCAIAEGLLARYDRVIAVDCLHPQVHASGKRPDALDERVQLVVADVSQPDTWDSLLAQLAGVDTVVHLAAETGTAQSMALASRHAGANILGTTQMMDALVRHEKLPRQVLLTSSRSVYGEGAWRRADGTVFYPGQRSHAQLMRGEWDFPGAEHIPCTAGETAPGPASVYAATKLCQENLLGTWGKAYGSGIKVLRLQNVYGPGQSLSNPYTGIVSLFVRLAKAGEAIPLYEDGQILRDFVLIDDVAEAILRALDAEAAAGETLDVGTGERTTIAQIAGWIAAHYGAPAPRVTGQFRDGDVRHASCRMDRTKDLIGFTPRYTTQEGLLRLCTWIDQQLDT